MTIHHKKTCKTIVESELTKNNFSIYGWRQVPVNPKVLGEKALSNYARNNSSII